MTLRTALGKRERYLLATRGEEVDRPPVWIMRQAGRYLPEYRALRSRHSFHDFCLNPEVSAAATVMPVEILDVDVAIIFNDILIPLEAMGMPVTFPEGGPQIAAPIRSEEDLEGFRVARFSNPPVAQSIARFRELLPEVPILGFCGAPFTLAAYAIAGRVGKNPDELRGFLYRHPGLFRETAARLTETATNYLVAQIAEGGADGVQIFESWGGVLAMPADYEEFAAQWQRRLITGVRAACPDTPIHLYVRGCAGKLESMAASGADVLGIDWSVPLAVARATTPLCLQGNLDPMVLTASPDAVDRAVERMMEEFNPRRGWIANLGHGITPDARVESARAFVQSVRRVAAS